jgi:hypothetical protein
MARGQRHVPELFPSSERFTWMIEGSVCAGRPPSPSGSRRGFLRCLGRPWGKCWLPAEDVSLFPSAGSWNGEELLVSSYCGAYPQELPRPRVGSDSLCASAPVRFMRRPVLRKQLETGKSSLPSFKMAREFGWQRRQMDGSSSSPAKLSFRKGVQEEGLRGRCSSQSSRTCRSPPQGFQRYHPCGGNGFLYFVIAMGRLYFVMFIC